MLIQVHNHGPLILSTNYFESDLARAGKVYVSVNAGAIRILLPPGTYGMVAEMRTSDHVILSRGPWPAEDQADGIELLFDDCSQDPFVLHLTPASFDLLPAEPPPGREWVLTVWTAKDGKPHKALERICHWRRVPKIPCMRPWGE